MKPERTKKTWAILITWPGCTLAVEWSRISDHLHVASGYTGLWWLVRSYFTFWLRDTLPKDQRDNLEKCWKKLDEDRSLIRSNTCHPSFMSMLVSEEACGWNNLTSRTSDSTMIPTSMSAYQGKAKMGLLGKRLLWQGATHAHVMHQL